jgi:hypothetical protein
MFSLPLIRHEKFRHRRPRPAPDRRRPKSGLRFNGHPWLPSLPPASLLGSLALTSLGALGGGAAQAAEFSGICPVLGNTQPPYPTPPLPINPVVPADKALAIPQQPIEVTVGGKTYPICAVYMSINESAQPLPPGTILPPGAPLEPFPDLTKQPWISPQAPNNGSQTSRDFTDALIASPYWQANGEMLQVNQNDLSNQSDDESAYFLWNIAKDDGFSSSTFYKITKGLSGWEVNQSTRVARDERVWYWVLDAPGDAVPGPLPLLGAGAAYGWSRRLRQRIRRAG